MFGELEAEFAAREGLGAFRARACAGEQLGEAVAWLQRVHPVEPRQNRRVERGY